MGFLGGIITLNIARFVWEKVRELTKLVVKVFLVICMGNLFLVMCSSCYGGDLAKRGLVIVGFYCTIPELGVAKAVKLTYHKQSR